MESDNGKKQSRFEKMLLERTELLRQASAPPSMHPGAANNVFSNDDMRTEQMSSATKAKKRPGSEPNDIIPCTCEVSSRCQRAAMNGIRDCRTLVAPKRKKLIKPRAPYDARWVFPLITLYGDAVSDAHLT
jgi:hypothetical protein